MMEKLGIAIKIRDNTKDVGLRFFINEYINLFNEIQNIEEDLNKKELIYLKFGEITLLAYKSFDSIIGYLKKSKFDITEWELLEILGDVYVFFNESKKQGFNLIVSENYEVIPIYIDEESNEFKANSIQEAIENYKNIIT